MSLCTINSLKIDTIRLVGSPLISPATAFLCLRLLEKRRHYVIGLSERVKECKSVNATGIPNGILSKAVANPRLTEI